MPYPGNVHKYIMPVLLMSSCFQERLSVLAAPRMVRSTFLFARLRSAGHSV